MMKLLHDDIGTCSFGIAVEASQKARYGGLDMTHALDSICIPKLENNGLITTILSFARTH